MGYPQTVHRHDVDVVIVGAGGAGLRAALEAGPRVRTAVLGKVHPTRASTVLARDGIAAALGNVEPDDPQWHAFDTITAGDGLSDPAAVDALCADAPAAVFELERMGVPFSRTAAGRIDQRQLGGHTRDRGAAPVRRACYAADRTGHHVQHTLYQNCVRAGVRFFDEFHVVDLVLSDDGAAAGVVAYELATGDLHVVAGTAVVLASGGASRLFASAAGGNGLTGDAMGLVLRHGLPLRDMEFVQYSPTGLAGFGIALPETARQAGGVLRTASGEPSPQGTLLDLTGIAPDEFAARAPEVAEYVSTYLGPGAQLAPIPVRPVALGTLGGIPTTPDGAVLRGASEIVPGLYAAGDVACTGADGAHRLSGNGLAAAVVFGRRAGRAAAEHAARTAHPGLGHEPAGAATATISALLGATGAERVAPVRDELRASLDRDAGVGRSDESLARAQTQLAQLRARYAQISITNKGRRFNGELLAALELGTLLELADVLVAGARTRAETRGVHVRSDHPQRDDAAFAQHTLAFRHADGTVELAARRDEPVERST